MSDVPPVWIILTTYKRTELALKVIGALKRNLIWENIGWFIADDGSTDVDIGRMVKAIGQANAVEFYKSDRKGVGHNMNHAMRTIFNYGAELFMMMEDDWELMRPLDLSFYVNLLQNHEDVCMVRLGYLSVGLSGTTEAMDNHLWWRLHKNGYQYVFSGHACLRHKRMVEAYGFYSEGLSPGQNELDYCAKFNSKEGPDIVWDADFGRTGPFAHIGADSLANITPGGEE